MKLKTLALAAVLCVAAIGFQSCCSDGKADGQSRVIELPVPERAAGQTDVLGLAVDPIPTVRVAFIGVGMRGSGAVYRFMHIPGVEIVAICDKDEERVKKSNERLTNAGRPAAKEFYGSEDAWKELVAMPDIDLVYICTGWEDHTPMAVEAMKNGKHAAIEVPAAMSLDECWELVNTAEQTRKHCMMLENCVYDFFEITTLNMAQKGLFGEIVHVEGAYIHDLRSMNFAEKGEPGHYADMWRLKANTERTGDIYPTHGLGPVAQILGLHRGDKMNYLVSLNSAQIGMTEYAKKKFGEDSDYAKREYRMGDHTTTLIRTENGKSMMIQHDVTSPRPYSRIHQVSGTKGFAQKYPSTGISLEPGNEAVPSDYENLNGHAYVNRETYDRLMKDYQHPVVRQIGEKAKEVGGHGGMDFIMDYRLIYCLQNGLPLDMDVYDAAEWSCLTALSELSIVNNSAPVEIPDFTRGAWNRTKGQSFAFTEEDKALLGL